MAPPVTPAGFFAPMTLSIHPLHAQEKFAPPLARISRLKGGMTFPFFPRIALLFRAVLGSWFMLVALGASGAVEHPPTSGPTVPGSRAVLKGRIAYAPENAPECVKRAI